MTHLSPAFAALLLSLALSLTAQNTHAAKPATKKETPASTKAVAPVSPIIGHVHSAAPGTMRLHENVQSPLKAGDTIQAGDVVSTTQGSATLLLQDGTVRAAVRLKPATTARILLTPGKGLDTELKQGSLFSDIHNPQKLPHPFQIRTTTAVMGVRGTIFFVKEEPATKGTAAPGTTFLCPCVGKVAVSSTMDKKEKVLSGTHHDRPVMLKAKAAGGAVEMTDAPMGAEHTDAEAAELEKILNGAS